MIPSPRSSAETTTARSPGLIAHSSTRRRTAPGSITPTPRPTYTPWPTPTEYVRTNDYFVGDAIYTGQQPSGLRLRFRVTVNTDNRLMSATSMSREMALLAEAFSYGGADLQWFTLNAMKSSLIPFDERLPLINEVIKPAYAKLIG